MQTKPTPQQLLIRRIAALVIVLIVGLGAFKLTTSLISFITDAFAADPEQTISPTEAETNSNNLQKCNDEDILVSVGFE